MSRKLPDRAKTNLVGDVYGRLTVVSRANLDDTTDTFWLCECSCGASKVVRGRTLTHAGTKSCGCLQREAASKRTDTRCHPDRKHYGHGLCRLCWESQPAVVRNYADKRYRRDYGISIEDFEAMEAKQKYLCAICDRKCRLRSVLSVDHVHATGAIRGLLCVNCNLAIGNLEDSIDLLKRAIQYLENAS